MRAFFLLCLLAPIMAFEVEINHVGPANPVQVMQSRIMEKEITAILECIRDILLKGDESVGLPPLDPFVAPDVFIDLDQLGLQGLEGQLSVTGLTAAGIASWKVKKLKISVTIIPVGAKIQVDVNWPTGTIKGDFNADLSIFGHTIKGSGPVDGELKTLRFTLDAQVAIPPQIKSTKIGISLASSHLNLGTLTVDDVDIAGPINSLVSQLPSVVAAAQDELNKLLKDVIIPALNKLLGGKYGENGAMVNYDIPIIGKCLKLGY